MAAAPPRAELPLSDAATGRYGGNPGWFGLGLGLGLGWGWVLGSLAWWGKRGVACWRRSGQLVWTVRGLGGGTRR